LFYSTIEPTGAIQAYNRDTSSWLPLTINGSYINMATAPGSIVGIGIIGSSTYKLDVNGDIRASGNILATDPTSLIGIGTTGPQSSLDVNGTIRTTNFPPSPTSGSGLSFLFNPDPGVLAGYIQSYTHPSGPFRRLEINADPLCLAMNGGNVGIGTANP